MFESQFATVVDAMGEASAKVRHNAVSRMFVFIFLFHSMQAQDLRTPITTFQKLQSSKQALYTMKESRCGIN